MNSKSLSYFIILLVALVTASVLLNRGILQSAIISSEVTFARDTTVNNITDGSATGVPLGATSKFDGTIVIGEAEETIEEVTLEFVAASSSNPSFKLRVQPIDTTPSTFVKTFTSTTTGAGGNVNDGLGDGLLASVIPGTGRVKVTINTSVFSTLPSTLGTTLPGSLPGKFKGRANASNTIFYTVEWTPHPCQNPNTNTNCGSNETTKGNYDVIFGVKQPGASPVTATAQVTYIAIATPKVTVTSPTDGQGFTSLSDLDSNGVANNVLLQGTVNDGGIPQVTLAAAAVASAKLVGSPTAAPTGAFKLEIQADRDAVVTSGASATQWQVGGLWHVTNEQPFNLPSKPFEGNFGLYYGKDPDSTPPSTQFNFDTFFTSNSGGAFTREFLFAGPTTLKFKTWFNTEFGTFYDRKKVQFCTGSISSPTCTNIVQITDQQPPMAFGGGGFFGGFFPPPFGGGFGGGFVAPEPGTVYTGFGGEKLAYVPNNFFGEPKGGFFFGPQDPETVEVVVDLKEALPSNLVGQTGRIRFFFDSVDGISNFGNGWYVDDVLVEGEGAGVTGGFTVNKANLTWEGVVEAAEGKNVFNLTGHRTVYQPVVAASTTVTFYFDKVAPKDLVINDPELLSFLISTTTVFVTSASTLELGGSFTEAFPDTLTVERRTASTAAPVTISTLDTRFGTSTVVSSLSLKASTNEFDSKAATTLSTSTTAGGALISTTLADKSIAGATILKVASVAGLSVNDIVKIDTLGRAEVKKVSAISDTANTLTLSSTLSLAHDAGVAVVEQETIIVDSLTDMEVGKFIKIDTLALEEVGQINFVDTPTKKLALSKALGKSHTGGVAVKGAEDKTFRTATGQSVSLSAGYNKFTATLTDKGGATTTASLIVLRDNTAPTGFARVVTIVSDDQAVVGDQFFLLVGATDGESQVASVSEAATGKALVAFASLEPILSSMHDMSNISSATSTTHARLSSVAAGTPIGLNSISVKIKDTAENETTIAATLDVVSSRTNRNFFLFPNINFVGLALIPDDNDSSTTGDDSLDRLMDQVITTKVNPAYAANHTHVGHATSGVVTLGDVVVSTSAYKVSATSSAFVTHTPATGAPPDTLTLLKPFQGTIVRVRETATTSTTTLAVFKKVAVTGFTAQQSVPIKMNIKGVFFQSGEVTPPSQQLFAGFNLVAPHILSDALFDDVYRGALIPDQLAVSAISLDRNVSALDKTTSITAEILEKFVVNTLGKLLKPSLSYWTFIVSGSPTITP